MYLMHFAATSPGTLESKWYRYVVPPFMAPTNIARLLDDILGLLSNRSDESMQQFSGEGIWCPKHCGYGTAIPYPSYDSPGSWQSFPWLRLFYTASWFQILKSYATREASLYFICTLMVWLKSSSSFCANLLSIV